MKTLQHLDYIHWSEGGIGLEVGSPKEEWTICLGEPHLGPRYQDTLANGVPQGKGKRPPHSPKENYGALLGLSEQ